MDIEIKDAYPEDALGINTVLYHAWLSTYHNEELGVTKEDIEESYRDTFNEDNIKKKQEILKNTPENKKHIVAKRGNDIVGVATMVRNEDNNQLKTIYVHPDYHRKGIGALLWNEIKKFADPNKKIIVQVATYNDQAINFYKKIGFEDTGKRFTDERFRMKSGAIIPEMELIIK
jgi:ribosomal protein S18 acetylase RimI-like enzyme